MNEQRPKSSWVGAKNLGDHFIDPDGSIWKMVCFCDLPQATFERVTSPRGTIMATGAQVTHVVGCLTHQEMGLRRLVPEEPK